MPGADPVSTEFVSGHAPAGATSSLRRNLLFRLRRSGPASPDDLARALGASRTGVLQQLRALQAAGLVTRETVRHGVGRPRHIYDLARDAQSLFPANYDGLAIDLMAAIDRIGGDALAAEVFAARRTHLAERVRARVRSRAGAPLLDRVRELAVIQDELGYLTELQLEPDGKIRLREHNCAIYEVACNHPAACESELELFQEVLGADVARETHIAAGDRCCTYVVNPRPS